MQYVCIRQTKRLKKGINIHDQLFTIHTPSSEHQESRKRIYKNRLVVIDKPVLLRKKLFNSIFTETHLFPHGRGFYLFNKLFADKTFHRRDAAHTVIRTTKTE